MATRKLLVEIIGDDASLQRALRSSNTATKSYGGTLTSFAKTAAFAAGAAGLGAVTVALKMGYDEWQQSTKVTAQTEAVIKSTGGTAHVTAKQVDELSNALLRKSGVDDEAIKTGENMLLTFTNIRNEAGKNNDIFTQSTEVLLDMTVAMNQGNVTQENMTKQAIQLGKALNDPVKGLTALRRVGVQFTAGQEALIQKLVESGHVLEAQKVILKELNKEFGGSAEALGKTLPGQINVAKEEFKNLTGELFKNLVPALNQVLQTINQHWPEIERVMSVVFKALKVGFDVWVFQMKVTMHVIRSVIAAVNVMRSAFRSVAAVARSVFGTLANWLQTIIDKVEWLIGKIGAVKNAIPGIGGGGHSIPTPIPGVTIPLPFASGGIVTRPTFAMIGESGPEAVIPLRGGGFGGVHIHMNGTYIGGKRQLEEEIVNGLSRWARRNGNSSLRSVLGAA